MAAVPTPDDPTTSPPPNGGEGAARTITRRADSRPMGAGHSLKNSYNDTTSLPAISRRSAPALYVQSDRDFLYAGRNVPARARTPRSGSFPAVLMARSLWITGSSLRTQRSPFCGSRSSYLLFSFSLIDTSSTSKISVEFGPISAPGLRSPYARSDGMNSCHFEPTGISCSASVHPLMTWLTPTVVGSFRL